jgi:hypothetical protein
MLSNLISLKILFLIKYYLIMIQLLEIRSSCRHTLIEINIKVRTDMQHRRRNVTFFCCASKIRCFPGEGVT